MINYNNRISKARKIMERKKIDLLFLPSSGDAEYLTGIKRIKPQPTHVHSDGDWLNGAFITLERAIYVVSKMPSPYITSQISDKSFIKDVVILEEGKDYFAYIKDALNNFNIKISKIAIPKTTMAKTLINFKKVFPEIQFSCTEDFTRQMRMIKEKEEVDRISKAAKITDEIFTEVVKKIKLGMTEIDIAQEIDYQILLRGAEGTSFDTDVMVKGPNVKETGGSGFAILGAGCNVSFDFGMVFDGYCSDFGRTIYLGEPSNKIKKIHKLVIDSQEAAIKAMIPNKITAEQLDKIARDIVEAGGYSKENPHRLGHSIGIDVHEYPYLGVGYSNLLQENMTFTIEPKVIIPGECRIRVEDVVLVTPGGGKCLNKATKDLIIIE